MFPGLFLYLGLFAVGLADALLLWMTGSSLDPATILFAFGPAAIAGFLAGAARIFREKPYPDRAVSLCDGLFFILTGAVLLPLLNHLTYRFAFPYTDVPLIAAEAFFILPWKSYFIFALEHRTFLQILFGAYALLGALSLGFFLSLMLSGQRLRGEFYVAAYFLTAILCILIGILFPTRGPFLSMLAGQVPKELMGNLVFNAYHVAYLEKLRIAGPLVLRLNDLPGLTCFPSFHTAAAIVFAWSSRNTSYFRMILIYAIVMIASTPIVGGHYFIDLFGGAVIAVITLLSLQRTRRYALLFQKP
ncbi:MAG: hypothetical protein JWO78_84 [Micavibrio sp.]|nr:hypothetical protein [Micavibrio sp.]